MTDTPRRSLLRRVLTLALDELPVALAMAGLPGGVIAEVRPLLTTVADYLVDRIDARLSVPAEVLPPLAEGSFTDVRGALLDELDRLVPETVPAPAPTVETDEVHDSLLAPQRQP